MMEEKLYLALHGGVVSVSPDGRTLGETPLEGALALCVGGRSLFCADQSGAIWRFDRQTLMPCALGCGGPGICAMCLSPENDRLFALLGEADSVLMSDAQTGRALAVNRCGCNPGSMALCGELLVCAGGKSRHVHLFCARTLDCVDEIQMPGDVCSAAVCEDVVYALCLMEDMNALLVAAKGEKRICLRLCGMPGCIHIDENRIYAATQGWLHVFSCNGLRLLARRAAPGRMDRILSVGEWLIVCDPLSECAYLSLRGGAWRRLCCGVMDICLG